MTSVKFLAPVLFFMLVNSVTFAGPTVQHGLRVPPGFEVVEFADSKLANDIFCMTIDPKGRVVVSGRGYIRILVDDDGDGKADRAIPLADGPKEGAQGLYWEASSLYFTGDGGLCRYRLNEAGDKAERPAELIRAMKTGGEHSSHAILRGPDGWLYVLGGNISGVDKAFAQLPTSPIQKPVAGCVLRFSPDLKHSEIVADGFRNPYGMDFTSDGALLTYDSDNERCVALPWYEPTRCYQVIPGGHYGWLSPQRAQWWRLPPYAVDVVAPLATLGRGSPTGVACYRHTQFPKEYQGGVFLADWTFGRIYFMALQRSGSTYECRTSLFAESVGDNGFAPTALAVDPKTGDLVVAIGGRGTRGAVYRIRHATGFGKVDPKAVARLQPAPRSLDWHDEAKDDLLARASGKDDWARADALAAIQRHARRFEADRLLRIVQRNWDHPDRGIRRQTARLIASLDADQQRTLGKATDTLVRQGTYCLGIIDSDRPEVLKRSLQMLAAKDATEETRLAGTRLLQMALGNLVAKNVQGVVWEGYSLAGPPPTRNEREQVLVALRQAFPSGRADLDRELSRTLAALEDDDPATLDKVSARWLASSDPLEDIHYLIVMARLGGARSASLTRKTASALILLDQKITRGNLTRDRHWPLRIAEMHAEMAKKDPALAASLLTHADFGRPDHALYARAPGFDRRRAADIFLARSEKEADFSWSPEVVALLDQLPQERSLPVLRKLWDKGGLEDTITPLLARTPNALDRDKFLAGSNSPNLRIVSCSLDALEALPRRNEAKEILALIRCLRLLPEGKEADPLRKRVTRILASTTARKIPATDAKAWSEWFIQNYPDMAARLGGSDGVDIASWNKRLAKVDWQAGNMERGRGIFVKASCASCHSGGQALGPDLKGIGGRFSRADLLTAILQPSKDISPRFRTTLVATTDGKTYQGMVIYDAVDSLLLQTGPETTIRILGKQIEARRTTDISLMPAGLLDKLADTDIADLYAFLRGLK